MRASGWSDVSPVVKSAALALCKGEYQTNLVEGVESLSGSTLTGKAATYGSKYARSRAGLIRRLRGAGLHVSERAEKHGARVLVIRADFLGEGI